MNIMEVRPKEGMNKTGNLFQNSIVAILVFNLSDPNSLDTLWKITEDLFFSNEKIYSILVGTHKDKERKVEKQAIEQFENFFFIDHTFETSTEDAGINECEAVLKLAAALVSKTIKDFDGKHKPFHLGNYQTYKKRNEK